MIEIYQDELPVLVKPFRSYFLKMIIAIEISTLCVRCEKNAENATGRMVILATAVNIIKRT